MNTNAVPVQYSPSVNLGWVSKSHSLHTITALLLVVPGRELHTITHSLVLPKTYLYVTTPPASEYRHHDSSLLKRQKPCFSNKACIIMPGRDLKWIDNFAGFTYYHFLKIISFLFVSISREVTPYSIILNYKIKKLLSLLRMLHVCVCLFVLLFFFTVLV